MCKRMRYFWVLFIVMIGGCSDRYAQYNGLERFNRKMFDFNQSVFDKFRSKDNAQVPSKIRNKNKMTLRQLFGNIGRNLKRPISILNCLLQFRFKQAIEGFISFGLDSTIGFFGAINIGERSGIIHDNIDFADTLTFYTKRQSAYIVLPFKGGLTFWDLLGYGLNYFVNPVFLVMGKGHRLKLRLAGIASNAISKTEGIEDTVDKARSVLSNPYILEKNYILSRRNFFIKGGNEHG